MPFHIHRRGCSGVRSFLPKCFLCSLFQTLDYKNRLAALVLIFCHDNLRRRRAVSAVCFRRRLAISVVHAALKSQSSRCSTSLMTSPPTAQPRQFQSCLAMLMLNRSWPPHFGHGPQRSTPPFNLMPRRAISSSIGTARALMVQLCRIRKGGGLGCLGLHVLLSARRRLAAARRSARLRRGGTAGADDVGGVGDDRHDDAGDAGDDDAKVDDAAAWPAVTSPAAFDHQDRHALRRRLGVTDKLCCRHRRVSRGSVRPKTTPPMAARIS